MSKREEDSEEYELMLNLEHLESLREEMLEAGVRTIEELEAKIADLHKQLDEMDSDLQ